MKVFVAGSTGAIGRPLVQELIARGHDVVGMTRSPERGAGLRALGADVAVADALDRDAVVSAVRRAQPDAVIHQLTAIDRLKNLRKFDREFAATNLLRTVGTDNLMAAARAAGVSRVVAQSYGSWIYARTGSGLSVETDDLDPAPPAAQAESFAAIGHLEQAVLGAPGVAGVVLRYAGFYGPGTSLSEHGQNLEEVRHRRLPIIGDGAGVWSFIHVRDAATATVAALDSEHTGVFNIVDDEPAPVHDWLPELARVIGAKPPMRVPTWVGRLATGDVGISMMTLMRGMSNAKARSMLDWRPAYPTYREGFANGLLDRSSGGRAAA